MKLPDCFWKRKGFGLDPPPPQTSRQSYATISQYSIQQLFVFYSYYHLLSSHLFQIYSCVRFLFFCVCMRVYTFHHLADEAQQELAERIRHCDDYLRQRLKVLHILSFHDYLMCIFNIVCLLLLIFNIAYFLGICPSCGTANI